MSLAMEPSPFQQFRDIIEFNYDPKQERELDDEADELFYELDWQIAKRYKEHSQSEKVYDQDEDENWDYPPEFLK